MKRFLLFVMSLLVAVVLCQCSDSSKSKYTYEVVDGDPMNTRIYTLPNGLKVYMSVNPEKPRIQTAIAVRVGGKNDPAETTGLAHYFEHLMFKGTKQFGTQNYELEKPLLDSIEAKFELYRKTTDETARKAIYKQIDSLSYEASKLAIPNEYDKLMAAIGASGTNAFTSTDMTVYIEDIPSNEVENWAKIQADRFQNAIIRGFHTELETVYEEKNMSLTQDGRKIYENMLSALFPNHPYGTQTVLGTQEHLKNPSITNIKNYYNQYYVPNNMAIVVAGDFNQDSMIMIVDRYFGGMKPNNDLPKLNLTKEAPMTEPVAREIVGIEAPNVSLGWRFDGAASSDNMMLELLSSILYNGKAGLIDLNVNQQQKVLSSFAFSEDMTDYSLLMVQARPKSGQTLEQVRDIMLAEIEKLKKGDFDEALLTATVNNTKRNKLEELESNWGRGYSMLLSFINETDWASNVTRLDNMSKVTKQQLVDFANQKLGNGYAVIYKREGKDQNEVKIAKPQITPIFVNRDTSSVFLREIQASQAQPISPVFVDFNKDMKILAAKANIPVMYKQNTTNGLFEMMYVIDMGSNEDKALGSAVQYSDYLGTSTKTPQQIKQELYNLACSYFVSTGKDRIYVGLRGLDENMDQAMAIMEDLLSDAQPNVEALENLKGDILKKRADAKLNQSSNFNNLTQYAIWGPKSPNTNILSEAEIKSLKPEDLISRLNNLCSYEHKILYYGPRNETELVDQINKLHKTPETLTPIVKNEEFKQIISTENQVFIAPYDAKQIYMSAVSNRGELFDNNNYPIITLYNQYFGGGMNSIVFQEMREARGLAYSAGAGLREPDKAGKPYIYSTFIATQNDKAGDALDAFAEIINNMPQSENAFKLAKENLMTYLRTERVTKSDILWAYLEAQDLGLNADRRQQLYDQLESLTLEDVKAFQEKWVKDRTYTYCILGDVKDLDLKKIETYGKIKQLKPTETFGY